MGTISDTTHVKTIFSFLPGTGKRFIGNALRSSDGCYATLSHFAPFHNEHRKKKPDKSNLEEEVPGNGSPLPVQKGIKTTGEVRQYTI
jgi:hypothetical protein